VVQLLVRDTHADSFCCQPEQRLLLAVVQREALKAPEDDRVYAFSLITCFTHRKVGIHTVGYYDRIATLNGFVRHGFREVHG